MFHTETEYYKEDQIILGNCIALLTQLRIIDGKMYSKKIEKLVNKLNRKPMTILTAD